MIWFYRLLYLPVFLVLFPYYLMRMLKRGGYSKDFHHRFGLVPKLSKPSRNRVWIHAVSVGEVNATAPLIDALAARGDTEIILSTTTSTAYRIAKRFENKATLCHFPFDFYLFSSLAWSRLQPTLALIIEGEMWPEHIQQARSRKVPIALLSGRLSDNSFQNYFRVKPLAKWLFSKLSLVLTGTDQDQERFLTLGSSKEKTHKTGSFKFDAKPPKLLNNKEKEDLKAEMGFDKDSLILLGSSTWSGEEILLAETLEKALLLGLNVSLLIIPRHAERREEIRQLLNGLTHPFHFRSDSAKAPSKTGIYVADTTGEAQVLSQIADVSFIGKSTPPHVGGQTPIEPASLGLAMVYGPNMSNFKDACKGLEAAQGASFQATPRAIKEKIIDLLRNEATRKQLSQNALDWCKENQGAVERTLKHLDPFLHGKQTPS